MVENNIFFLITWMKKNNIYFSFCWRSSYFIFDCCFNFVSYLLPFECGYFSLKVILKNHSLIYSLFFELFIKIFYFKIHNLIILTYRLTGLITAFVNFHYNFHDIFVWLANMPMGKQSVLDSIEVDSISLFRFFTFITL